ncbi:hypothetical protein H1235_02485 [Pseudoxanthomonas sp. NC8]|nr:hypothetical protein H1235_02485 [Pseudoxanthomonas sp. NC8]
MLACLSVVGVARAQSEAKTWYVPWVWSPGAGAEPGSITVVNFNGEVVRVNVRAFNAQGTVLSATSAAFSLQPGASSPFVFPVDPRGRVDAVPAFVLVLADQPVLVRAQAAAVLRPFVDVERDCRRISSRGTPDGVLFCDGQLGRYDADGKFQHDSLKPWKYSALQEWPAFPIDCTGSTPTHFACSKRVARQLPGGDNRGPPPVDRVNRDTSPNR